MVYTVAMCDSTILWENCQQIWEKILQNGRSVDLAPVKLNMKLMDSVTAYMIISW